MSSLIGFKPIHISIEKHQTLDNVAGQRGLANNQLGNSRFRPRIV